MIIELNKAKKEFNDGKNKVITPINDIQFSVDQNDYIVITGPSGVGKSTLLNIIGCIDQLTSGEYLLNGKKICEYTEKQKAEIRNSYFGYVLQNHGLISYRNVFDNVSVPLMFNKNIKKKEYKERIEYALSLVGMQNFGKRYINELSGGERQRVSIARALVNDPKIILADEPTGSLDVRNKMLIMDHLFKFKEKNKTLIMVTHDMEIANEFANRFSFTLDGKLKRVE